jgi:hypothetical protein
MASAGLQDGGVMASAELQDGGVMASAGLQEIVGNGKCLQSFCGEIRKREGERGRERETSCDIQLYKKSSIKVDLEGK